MLQAVIFDVDGTLADTEEAHRRAFNAAFAEAGLPWQWDAALYRDLLAIAGGKERIAHYCQRFAPQWLAAATAGARIAELHAAKTRHYETLVASGAVAARPGVIALIESLMAARIRLAIATTTSRRNVEALLAHTLAVLPATTFEVIGCGEEAAQKKPAPDIYHWVLSRLGLPAAACLAIEDSRNGLCAAQAAGVPVLVTENQWTQGEDFTGALAVLPNLTGVDRTALMRLYEEGACHSSI